MKVWVRVTGLRGGKLLKKRLKENANNTIVESFTNQFKAFNTTNSDMS